MEKDILKIISVFSGLLPIVLFLVFYKRNNESKLWVIFLYAILSVFTDAAFSAIPTEEENVEFYLFSLFTIIEYSIFTVFIFLIVLSA